MDAKRVLFEKDLPDELRPLLDSNRALPGDVQFFPAPPVSRKGVGVWALLAVISAVAAVVCFVIYRKNYTTDLLSGSHYISQKFFGGFCVCVLLTIGWVWKAIVDLKRTKQVEQGVAERYGLFLTPKELFIWGDLSRLFPRETIVSYTTDPIVKDGIRFIRSDLKFRTASGAVESLSHVEDCVVPEMKSAAADAILAWAPKANEPTS